MSNKLLFGVSVDDSQESTTLNQTLHENKMFYLVYCQIICMFCASAYVISCIKLLKIN